MGLQGTGKNYWQDRYYFTDHANRTKLSRRLGLDDDLTGVDGGYICRVPSIMTLTPSSWLGVGVDDFISAPRAAAIGEIRSLYRDPTRRGDAGIGACGIHYCGDHRRQELVERGRRD